MEIIKEEFSTLSPKIDALLLPGMLEHSGKSVTIDQKIAFALQENGEFYGGIAGSLSFENFHINGLAIDVRFRNQNYGTALMEAIEHAAAELGAKLMTVSTLSFQALEFYEKLGYQVFGSLEDCPFKGVTKYYLYKRFD
ncbi:MAG: GNAT family N-acetyltransferase [Streptococcaceae bacterium]|jgi:ribosomal protein S18 acetylase RimI-like enzyme|nr:GNAT family N-acetyltransferase [Streptococcaceae bacterium]